MTRLSLPQVTLVAIDTRAPALALQSLQRSMASIDFGRVVLFTAEWQPAHAPRGVELVAIDPIDSAAGYSRFVLRQLAEHIHTPHVLVTQWDGFVCDPSAWRDEFLDWDYIGAVWPDQPAGRNVGNGGFSLRSQRLLRAGQDPRITTEHPEDEMLCRRFRDLLEGEHGLRFAPADVAQRFAFENMAPRGPVFGFHGPYRLPRLLDEATLIGWLAALPDPFYRSRDARRLARSLLLQRMPDAAAALLRRRAAAGHDTLNTRAMMAAARLLKACKRAFSPLR
ncbi:MAG: DUF5672 family protein [Rubrivivax sp.]